MILVANPTLCRAIKRPGSIEPENIRDIEAFA